MRSENEARNTLPVSRDGKRSLQAPWGAENGAEDGGRYRAYSASPAEEWKVHKGGEGGASLHSRTHLEMRSDTHY
jgi:hypothetical protein